MHRMSGAQCLGNPDMQWLAWARVCIPPQSGPEAEFVCFVRGQERPEDVPVGELPRAVTLIADRHLVGRVAPGTRVTITGIYSIYQAGPPPQPAGAAPHHRRWLNAGPRPGREASTLSAPQGSSADALPWIPSSRVHGEAG